MSERINTVFGSARISPFGYYVVRKGNSDRLLHRLIYERFWGVELPKEVIIHHKDGNKLNNCILNLEALTREEHNTIHHDGFKHSDETMEKMSRKRNTTGYFRVTKQKSKDAKQGFLWKYLYYEEFPKQKAITSATIEGLKKKVLAKGLVWKEI